MLVKGAPDVTDKPLPEQTWPNSQIPECTCSISHNSPFRTEMCTFLFWMGHCGTWNWCILGFVKLFYLTLGNKQPCCSSLCVPPLLFFFQTQSPQVVFVVSSSPMEAPISEKKAKIIRGLGATQLTIGILEILFNIGGSIMWARMAYFIGAGYWCGLLVSPQFLLHICIYLRLQWNRKHMFQIRRDY